MIVALDTSTLTLSLAVHEGDRVVREDVALGPPKRLSTVLPKAISELVAARADRRASWWAWGPGSFTGLRISLSCVKGLAYALRVPVAGVSSLAAVAAEGPPGVTLFAAAVVKKGELYLRRGEREEVLTVAGFAQAMHDAPCGGGAGAPASSSTAQR